MAVDPPAPVPSSASAASEASAMPTLLASKALATAGGEAAQGAGVGRPIRLKRQRGLKANDPYSYDDQDDPIDFYAEEAGRGASRAPAQAQQQQQGQKSRRGGANRGRGGSGGGAVKRQKGGEQGGGTALLAQALKPTNQVEEQVRATVPGHP
jgi:hypothetical protein